MARILGIDHVTFAVRDLGERMSVFERVFGARPLFRLVQGDATAVSFEIGGKIFNFVSEAPDASGAFAEFLRTKGEGLHHIALAVDDMDAFKEGLAARGIQGSRWVLESDREERDEVMIDPGPFPATLQIVRWEDNVPPSSDRFVDRTRKLSAEGSLTDLRQSREAADTALATRAKVLNLDHVCFAIKDRDQTVSFVENVLGGRFLAAHSRGGEMRSNFMEIGGDIHNFVTAPEDGTSFFADFLRKKGEDLHHIGVSIDSLDAFKQGMAANGIKIPEWELEGDQAIRDEVLIGTRHSPTVVQVIEWAGAPPSSADEWMELEEKYTAGG